MDDHELLGEYVRNRSQDAFERLVDRHVAMVYSAARRMVGDAHLAEEVAQSVFTTLAQKAGSVVPPQVVAGWLYNTTRYQAMHAVRTEQRRRVRERAAAIMQSLNVPSDSERVIEQLEPAMAELETDERDVLVLRYLENRSLRETGAELGISEDAARMRVNRALEQLRIALDRHGVGITTVLLASVLATGTSSAVPVGLSAAIATTALTGTAVTIATHTLLTTMSWINTKSIAAIIGAAILAGTATYFTQQREINRLRAEYARVETESAKPSREGAVETSAPVPTAEADFERLRKENSDLLRLRNEVGQLRRQLDEAQAHANAGTTPGPKTTPTPRAPHYFSKENLAYAGYATPEAALQTLAWSTMAGMALPSQIDEGLSPSMLTNAASHEGFEMNRKMTVPLFKGIQMMAKKTISEDKVEFRLRLDMNAMPNSQQPASTELIIPLLKIADQWKMDNQPSSFRKGWEEDGQVEVYSQ